MYVIIRDPGKGNLVNFASYDKHWKPRNQRIWIISYDGSNELELTKIFLHQGFRDNYLFWVKLKSHFKEVFKQSLFLYFRMSSIRLLRLYFPTWKHLPIHGLTSKRRKENTSKSTKKECRWRKKDVVRRNLW